jgi:hypothetical protein
MKSIYLAALSALAFASAAQAANIDTTGTTNTTVQPFGAPDTATYGQSFTVAAGDTQLTSFSMFLNGTGASLTFRGYLAAWDGAKATSLLYTSADTTISSGAGNQEFTFTPNIAVTPGSQYIAFLSISQLAAQPASTYTMPIRFGLSDILPGGGFFFQNNGTDFASLFANNWSGFGESNDVAFKATFAAVPEPATWAMMIGGFGLAGMAARRRAKATVTFA